MLVPRTPCGNDLKESDVKIKGVKSFPGCFLFLFLNPHEVIGKANPPTHLVCRPPPAAAALPAGYMPGGCWANYDMRYGLPKTAH